MGQECKFYKSIIFVNLLVTGIICNMLVANSNDADGYLQT
jgi:hypothetical protein